MLQALDTPLKIYTFGYAGSTPTDLKLYRDAIPGVWVDTRLAPYSQVPAWHGSNIAEAVGSRNYVHLKTFGNENYRSAGPIQLQDPEAGCRAIQHIVTRRARDIILLCGCRDWQSCHRSVVANLLVERFASLSPEVIHLPTHYSEWRPSETAHAPIRVLSLIQPWATLMACGAKRIETRSWRTPYRGLLAIHASKAFAASDRRYCYLPAFKKALVTAGYNSPDELPLGSILAVGKLVDCVATNILAGEVRSPEKEFGNFQDGRYGWLFEGIKSLPQPIPARGARLLWSPEANVEENLLEFYLRAAA